MQSFLFDRVASSKIPQHVYIVAGLPPTQTVKVHVIQLNKFSTAPTRFIRQREISKLLILEIWQRLLGRTDFGVDDNFFELGGDFLLGDHDVAGSRGPDTAADFAVVLAGDMDRAAARRHRAARYSSRK